VLTYPIITTVGMGKMAQVVTMVPCIQKTASSNLSWHTGYNDRFIVVFLSPTRKCQDNTL